MNKTSTIHASSNPKIIGPVDGEKLAEICYAEQVARSMTVNRKLKREIVEKDEKIEQLKKERRGLLVVITQIHMHVSNITTLVQKPQWVLDTAEEVLKKTTRVLKPKKEMPK